MESTRREQQRKEAFRGRREPRGGRKGRKGITATGGPTLLCSHVTPSAILVCFLFQAGDLGRLLELYRGWQRQIYPNAKSFEEFVGDVEKFSSQHLVKVRVAGGLDIAFGGLCACQKLT